MALRCPCRLSLVGTLLAMLPLGSVCGAEFDLGQAVLAAATALEREHFTRRPLDDNLSKAWIGRFVDQLDPQRLYFLDSDLRDFGRYTARIKDLARAKDVQFPKLVLARFQLRVSQVLADNRRMLRAVPDFSRDEDYPGEFNTFAMTREELQDRWRLRMKAELLIEKVSGKTIADVRVRLLKRCARVEKQVKKIDDQQLAELYIGSLCTAYDPHSGYISPNRLALFNI